MIGCRSTSRPVRQLRPHLWARFVRLVSFRWRLKWRNFGHLRGSVQGLQIISPLTIPPQCQSVAEGPVIISHGQTLSARKRQRLRIYLTTSVIIDPCTWTSLRDFFFFPTQTSTEPRKMTPHLLPGALSTSKTSPDAHRFSSALEQND